MGKFISYIKKNKKYIFIFAVFAFVIFQGVNTTFAAINSTSNEIDDGSLSQDVAVSLQNLADKLISLVASIPAGTVTRLVSGLITALAGVGFLLLYTVWILFGGTVFNLPFPDKIIFNEMSFFDPNFINQTENLTEIAQKTNLMEYIGPVAQSIYFTFFIIAGLIMVVAAMVIGIKLAMSSIAVEKAQYKETLNKWLVGIVLLFCLHFILLGVFTINEQICEIADEIAGNCEFKFDFTGFSWFTKAVGSIKYLVTKIVGVFNDNVTADASLDITFYGYSGIIWYLILSVVLEGDIISAIALLALVGQTINLIIQYLKRFIFVIFLAMISPLVVAVDVVKKAI